MSATTARACPRPDALGIRLVLVRLAEAAQVRPEHIRMMGETGNKLIPIGVIPRPAVQQHDRGS
jgi:hypothetical protein